MKFLRTKNQPERKTNMRHNSGKTRKKMNEEMISIPLNQMDKNDLTRTWTRI
jgi:hypothetical protein